MQSLSHFLGLGMAELLCLVAIAGIIAVLAV